MKNQNFPWDQLEQSLEANRKAYEFLKGGNKVDPSAKNEILAVLKNVLYELKGA